jgi:branched-chain amino acid transport system permease protein
VLEVSGTVIVSGVINGLCLAGIYILIALGFTLILSIMNILQFAHGEIYMIGAFITYFLAVKNGINVFLAMFISMIAVGIFGLILEKYIFRRFMGKFLPIICVTVGLMLILQSSVALGFGVDQKIINNVWPGVLHLDQWTIPYDRLIAVLVSIGLTLLLFFFLKFSKYGQAIVATAQNREIALLQGINPNLMYAIVMGIGCALAAVAGSFGGAIFVLSPFMGFTAMLKGILIIVLGGMGSLLGVVVGGIILGLMDGLIPTIFGPAAGVIAPMVLIIFILIIKPEGMFGHE